jgi:hypothetical protein
VSRIVLSGDQTLRSGWIRLKNGSGTVNLTVSAVFQTFSGDTLASEASVLESPLITAGLIYAKTQSGTSNVGVAFSNSGTDPITVTLDLFTSQGDLVSSIDLALPPNGHLAKFLTEFFPGVSDFAGALSIHSTGTFSAMALRLSFDKVATLPVAPDSMFRPAITAVRITGTQRSTAQVNFSIDVVDFNADIATSSSTAVSAIAQVTFDGTTVYDVNQITIDGTGLANRPNGTLNGSFQPRVTGIPSGQTAVFYILIFDAAGNPSNTLTIPFKF